MLSPMKTKATGSEATTTLPLILLTAWVMVLAGFFYQLVRTGWVTP